MWDWRLYWSYPTCLKGHSISTTWINTRHTANSHCKQRRARRRKERGGYLHSSFFINVTKVSWHISHNESQPLPSQSFPFQACACFKLLYWCPLLLYLTPASHSVTLADCLCIKAGCESPGTRWNRRSRSSPLHRTLMLQILECLPSFPLVNHVIHLLYSQS